MGGDRGREAAEPREGPAGTAYGPSSGGGRGQGALWKCVLNWGPGLRAGVRPCSRALERPSLQPGARWAGVPVARARGRGLRAAAGPRARVCLGDTGSRTCRVTPVFLT